ncbi:HNH endonuclease [Clostridium perfringens]|nr:HNH endonuclease [Clostridium perfringens]
MKTKTSRIWTIEKELFSDLVKNNYCIRDIVKQLGYSPTSGSMAIKVKERIALENLDTSHFKGRQAKSSNNSLYSLESILVKNSKYTNMYRLKKRLIEAKLLEYKCEICNNKGEWNGKPLTLQIDHINGIHSDNRIENLRFLCPNCHSQTETFSGKNMGKLD